MSISNFEVPSCSPLITFPSLRVELTGVFLLGSTTAETSFIGIYYRVKNESEDGGSCLYRRCFHDLWWDACVVVAV